MILLDPRHSEFARQEIVAAFEIAAKAGNTAGQYSLGVCYEEGKGVPRDLEKALFWYTTAAAAGDRDAELAVARLCSDPPKN
jgi:TPR repeat protein